MKVKRPVLFVGRYFDHLDHAVINIDELTFEKMYNKHDKLLKAFE